jgi:bifunctional non-homologous end joining protein LigD
MTTEAEKKARRKERRDLRKAKSSGQQLVDQWMSKPKAPSVAEDLRPVHSSKFDGKYPTQIAVMLANDKNPLATLKDHSYLLQRKWDGSRCIAIKRDGKIWLMGRSWKNDFGPGYPEIISELNKLPAKEFILDGELTFFTSGGKNPFVTALATGGTKAQYKIKLMLFDVLEYAGRDFKRVPLTQRLAFLERNIPRSFKHVTVVETHTDVSKFPAIFKAIVDAGGEGVVTKKKNSLYVGDSRGFWCKVKKESTEDVVVLGITHGENKRSTTFGALILGQYDKNGQMKAIGKSSGFTDEMLGKLYKTMMAMPEVKSYPGVDIKDVKRWVAPHMVIEVEYMEKTPYGILRHPRFLRIRDDKLPKQCVIS